MRNQTKTKAGALCPLFFDNLHLIVDLLPKGKHGKYFLLSLMKRAKIAPSIITACENSNFLIVKKETTHDENNLFFYLSL